MDFGRKGLQKQLKLLQSKQKRIQTKSAVGFFKLTIVAILFAGTVSGFTLWGAAQGILNESPDMGNIDVAPKGLASTIYDAGGNEIQTLIGTGANRSLITYSQLPQNMINAIVAIEDERFWTHEGVDFRGMIRAGYIGLSSGGSFSEGASTITQQLIKNNVFEGGSEKTFGARLIRKLQEQALAMELEHVMSKEKILENYLNTINLGANCLGVQKAAERYFAKDVSDLTLSECATIAAITQNPYKYNPITHPEANAKRREKVLDDMKEQELISAEEKAEALADPVYDRIQMVNSLRDDTQTVYSYFVDRLVKDVLRDLKEAGYTDDQASSMLYSGGLQIYSTQNPDIQAIVDAELENPDNYAGIANKFSFTYSLTVKRADNSRSYYTEQSIRTANNLTYLDFNSEEEIYELVRQFEAELLMEGDETTGGNEEHGLAGQVSLTLQPQASVVVMDQSTGHVLAITGGRGEKTTSLSLNRATNTSRQPGSTFKVLASFAPAIDAMGDTLASTYYDEPYTLDVDGTSWTPKNWYSASKYAGYANIRQGIIYSMNIVAVRCLAETVSPELAFQYAENFGFNTLIAKDAATEVTGQHDVRATLALGGLTQGVTNMQLTAAYAAIANEGMYNEPVLYTKILDNDGRVLIDNTPESHQVIKDTTAFLLTDAMQDSLEDLRLNGLFGSSSSDAKPDRMPAAGKSGTTSSYNDLWFVGYTPYYTMGIWSGFDDNNKFSQDDDRSFHKTIWKKVMDKINDDKLPINFHMPSNIVECEICTKSGQLATSACKADVRLSIVSSEYFVSGTEPVTDCSLHYSYSVCSQSGMKPGPYCQKTSWRALIKLPEETTGHTQDNDYAYSSKQTCNVCELATIPSEDETADGIDATAGGTGGGASGRTGGSPSANTSP